MTSSLPSAWACGLLFTWGQQAFAGPAEEEGSDLAYSASAWPQSHRLCTRPWRRFARLWQHHLICPGQPFWSPTSTYSRIHLVNTCTGYTGQECIWNMQIRDEFLLETNMDQRSPSNTSDVWHWPFDHRLLVMNMFISTKLSKCKLERGKAFFWFDVRNNIKFMTCIQPTGVYI